MDLGIVQQFHEQHIWMPKSPVHDDGVIEISAFTRKYGSQKKNKYSSTTSTWKYLTDIKFKSVTASLSCSNTKYGPKDGA